jgi:hypothetical protein
MIAKCLNCNRDYEQETQGALCPHEVGGPNSFPPWPKPEKKHILGMEPEHVCDQMLRNHFSGTRLYAAVTLADCRTLMMQFNAWLIETNETLQKLVLDSLDTALPAPMLLCDQIEPVTLAQHTKYVEEFLQQMYATMIDPVEQPKLKVAEMCELLLKTAREQREQIAAAVPSFTEATEPDSDGDEE